MRFLFRLMMLLLVLTVLALAGLRLAAHLRETEDANASPDMGRFVHTENGPIYAIAMGPPEGEHVLLIHGSVGWSGSWLHTLEVLADAGYFAVAIDVPPMGYSGRTPGADYGRAASADRILAFIDTLGLDPHIVAHSFGAGAAVESVMDWPASAQSLTIIAGALPLDPDGEAELPFYLRPVWLREVIVSATVTNPIAARPLLQAFLHRDEAATDEVLSVLRMPATQEGATEALAQWLPTLLVPPTDLPSAQSEAYRDLFLPVELIWGAEDATTPLTEGENLAALIPNATLTVIPDVGHIPMIEDEVAFHQALLAALARNTTR
ncbi:alpha/beta fold hydrolase [Gymnodinialimonas hymeniacidonis]|uniref:alpha/beta fold hydrolase n=1 Tax=Gymnodinialimonas hymeniacidonis TaxID=3126508 RepID=UPI0034C61A46